MSAGKKSANRSIKLLLAAEQGNQHRVKEYLELQVDGDNPADCQDDEGRTSLQIAAANGYKEIAQLLLAKGAALEIQNTSGWTALMLASYYGHLDVVQLLIKSGTEVNRVNMVSVTPLVCACRSGHLKVVTLLVDSGAEINIQFKEDSICSVTPLMTASQHGHLNVVKFLVNHNADVDHRNPTTGWTALMLASLNGHINIVRLLVEGQNANTDIVNVNDETALSLASVRLRDDVEIYLEQKTKVRPSRKGSKVKRPMIIDVARSGDVAKMKDLINLPDVNINFQDKDGATPLIYACMYGHTEIVELLLSKHADLNIQDTATGWTALMQATYYSHKMAMKLLLQVNADAHVTDNEGLTVFDIATIIANPEINRMLARCTLKNSPQENGKNHKMNRWVSEEDILDSDEKGSTKHWWSKVSDKIPSFRTSRGPVTFARVPVNPPDTIGAPSSGTHAGESRDEDDHSLRPSNSIISVLDSARAKKEKPRISLVSPQANLPDDVIAPVLPPFLKRATFELPKVPKDAKLQHNSAVDEVSTQSSTDSYATRQAPRLTNRTTYPSSTVSASTAQDNFDSPQSSMTSTSSLFTSVSRQRGKVAMPPAPTQHSAKKRAPRYTSPSPQSQGLPWQQQGPTQSPRSSVVAFMPPNAGRRSPQPNGASSKAPLPPVASHANTATNGNGKNSDDVVANMLDRLSLARYNDVFEEEEIDMETFLTMNDRDFREMGIQQTSHRKQLLQTITQINSGK